MNHAVAKLLLAGKTTPNENGTMQFLLKKWHSMPKMLS